MKTAGTQRDIDRARSIIDSFDFGYVVRRAVKDGMPPEVAPRALAELRTFLRAAAENPGVPLVPQSGWCDDLWHVFIMVDTRAYFRFCEAVYGEYLHHDGATVTPEIMAESRARSAEVFGAMGEAGVDCHISPLEARRVDCHISPLEARRVDCHISPLEARRVDCHISPLEAGRVDCHISPLEAGRAASEAGGAAH